MSKRVTVATYEPLQPVREGMWKRELIDQPELQVEEWFLDDGIETKPHGHGVDQAAYHVSGTFELTLAGETTRVVAGDAYFIGSNVPHSLRCIEKGSFLLTTVPNTAAAADPHGHGNAHAGHEHGGHRN